MNSKEKALFKETLASTHLSKSEAYKLVKGKQIVGYRKPKKEKTNEK